MILRQPQFANRATLSILAVAFLFGLGAPRLHAADEGVTVREVLELKAKLKQLERRLEAQERRARETRVAVKPESLPGPVVKGPH